MKPDLLRRIFEDMADAAAVVDLQWRYVARNAAHRELFGIPDRKFLGRSPADRIDRRTFDKVTHVLRAGGTFRGEMTVRGGDGRRVHVETAIFPVRDDRGKVIAYASTHREVGRRLREGASAKRALAELKRAQARIIRNEKLALMGMLVSGVAHEINNPINVVHGNLSLLRERCAPVTTVLRGRTLTDDARKCLASIPGMVASALKAASAARGVIREFRNFARDPRTGEPMDLNACLKETLAVLRKDLAGLRVRRRFGRIPKVSGFHGQMNQVFLNLIRNASEAMGGRGTLTVATARRGKGVRVTVSDTGPGVSKADRARIFDPFYTTKTAGRGMGLGLSISEAIVQNHGGRLSLSAKTGRGAAFTVDLPGAR
jgi:PAS domain S-box-containing protein